MLAPDLWWAAAEEGSGSLNAQILIGLISTVLAGLIATVVPNLFKRRTDRQDDTHWSYDQLQENLAAREQQAEKYATETAGLRTELREARAEFDAKIERERQEFARALKEEQEARQRDRARHLRELGAVWNWGRSVLAENRDLRRQWPPGVAQPPPADHPEPGPFIGDDPIPEGGA